VYWICYSLCHAHDRSWLKGDVGQSFTTRYIAIHSDGDKHVSIKGSYLTIFDLPYIIARHDWIAYLSGWLSSTERKRLRKKAFPEDFRKYHRQSQITLEDSYEEELIHICQENL